ncbi:hypothetical protein Ocin01_05937 [Orchesella cincta]|uniref:Uncharacterized protein n=1 Tax=Orchesella cincta TaxID=48709 RepID=A0A1D2N691_ORCCI|nr:hypothetical protein Ocin01_05937 [Orchesella cincta]
MADYDVLQECLWLSKLILIKLKFQLPTNTKQIPTKLLTQHLVKALKSSYPQNHPMKATNLGQDVVKTVSTEDKSVKVVLLFVVRRFLRGERRERQIF